MTRSKALQARAEGVSDVSEVEADNRHSFLRSEIELNMVCALLQKTDFTFMRKWISQGPTTQGSVEQ